mgnify:CR=1 FL=1|jgi:hypothetical protein
MREMLELNKKEDENPNEMHIKKLDPNAKTGARELLVITIKT